MTSPRLAPIPGVAEPDNEDTTPALQIPGPGAEEQLTVRSKTLPGATVPSSTSGSSSSMQARTGAGPAGWVTDFGDAFLAAPGDDVGDAELEAQVGAVLVPSHQDDPFRARPLG